MILADKIILLRKKCGWSQEELADKLEVSRQSVSKWESAQSIPDLDRILQLSQVFGVSTDTLLKDDIEINEEVKTKDVPVESEKYKVSMEQASGFIEKNNKTAPLIAIGVVLCILAPIVLILLSGLSEVAGSGISENLAIGIGLPVLLVLVAIGVGLFIYSGNSVKEYEFISKHNFESEYGVTGLAKQKKEEYRQSYSRNILIGVIICIISVIPFFVSIVFDNDLYVIIGLCVLLGIISCGVCLIVYSSVIQGTYDKLLQEGDYTKEKKSFSPVLKGCIAGYWVLVTGIFLFVGFFFKSWKFTWIIWVVAVAIYLGLFGLFKEIDKNRRNKK